MTSMENPGCRRSRRSWAALLLAALFLAGTGGPCSRSWAAECNTTFPEPFRVENATDADGLNAAVNCSDGGPLEATWVGAVMLDAPIVIGHGTFLSIAGAGRQAEVQGGLSTHMFDVSEGGELTLTGLTLSGGASSSGGAIHALGAKVKLVRCVFEGNSANDGSGGAVWASTSEVTISGGDFRNNGATENGGAVFTLNSELILKDGATFQQNVAVMGGALYCKGGPCLLSNAAFISNHASLEAVVSTGGDDEDSNRGGAAAFVSSEVTIADSDFTANSAQRSGGAVWGGIDTFLAVDGCIFRNNTTPKAGGALSASNATVGGGTELRYNFANEDGGAIFGWDEAGTIELREIICENNEAADRGGCFNTLGKGLVTTGTVMYRNVAYEGGCIYASTNCSITVEGGNFTCHAKRNGGFLFAADRGHVNITGGMVSNNIAERKGGAVYCSGMSDIRSPSSSEGSKVFIGGGTFVGNKAREVGGAVMIWGFPTLVTITGGHFENNYATLFGGFVFIELGASLICRGATIQGNDAGGQGGGIYARFATWVNSSCDLIGNVSPQGAAAYLTHVETATFETMEIAGNTASGGSAVFIANSSVIAKDVMLESRSSSQDESTSRAIQMDASSTLIGQECVFKGWLGDTVIYNSNPSSGSLVLDSCDFSGSSAAMAVISPYSDAEIRNALVGDETIANANNLSPLLLVDRALECANPNSCGPDGECVDSALGVLCECLPQSDECLDDGGAISLTMTSPPDTVTYSPSAVEFKLLVSAADNGTTCIIWDLEFKANYLSLTVVPSSGILHPGGNATVTVTGTPTQEDVGGVMTSSFILTAVGGGGSETLGSQTSEGVVELDVNSTFYLCPAFQYAFPVEEDDGEVSIECKQCTGIEGSEGVDCERPGATLASLPVRKGYWRSNKESPVIRPCLNSEACAGATDVSSSDDYCADGYQGPYCAVCVETYGQGVGRVCHSCATTTTKGRALVASGAICSILVLLLLLLVGVFLVGGIDAVGNVSKPVAPLPVFGGGTSRLLRRFTSSRSVNRRPSSVSTTGASMLIWRNCNQDRLPSAGGARVNGESMSLESHSPVATFAAGERMLGSSRYDSTHDLAPASQASTEDNNRGNHKWGCCFIGAKTKKWASLLPWNKIKIIVVVWQILTVFPKIAGVDYPPTYSRFLAVIDVVNFDLGQLFSASCLAPSVTFYERLLATTLVPLVLAAVLLCTYHLAKRRAGIGSHGVIARRAAWSRHMAAWLLLTFLVFTSASTVVFKTFACDESAVEGESYLREDYRLSCKSSTHTYFVIYAGFMVGVYPVGIPFLYFFILWRNRHLLNPRLRVNTEETEARFPVRVGATATTSSRAEISDETTQELEERVKMRKQHPDLVPSMFLWKNFGPHLYYYEVIECGRRMLLTGVLIFIAPHSPAQAAIACMFAFASLLGFELLRPHLDPADSWLYRLGCVVIFLSNFLGLLIQVDAAGQDNGNILGGLLVAINVLLALAVLMTSWFATQQQVDESQEESIILAVASTVVVPGVRSERASANHRRGPGGVVPRGAT